MTKHAVRSIEDTQRRLDNAIAAIKEDVDLKQESQERMIRQVYEEARSEVLAAVEDEREKLEVELRAARREAFAPPVIEDTQGRCPDPALVAKWYHEEIDKLKDIREPNVLEEVLQEALLLNNLPRAKAVLVRGYQLGNSWLVGKYFESFPDEKPYWDRLVEVSENYNEWEKGMSFFSAPHRLKPLEAYLA